MDFPKTRTNSEHIAICILLGTEPGTQNSNNNENQNMIFLPPDAGLGSLDTGLLRNKNAAKGGSGPSCLAVREMDR